MSNIINVTVDQNQIKAIMNKLDCTPKEARKALKQALNLVAKQEKREIPLLIKETYTIKRNALGGCKIKIKNATVGNLQTSLHLSGETMGLKKGYDTKKNSKKLPVRARVIRNNGMKQLELNGNSGGKSLKAFVAVISNSGAENKAHLGIFQRVEGRYMNRDRVTSKGFSKDNAYKPRKLKNGRMTKGRQGIRELYGMSVPKMAENYKVYGKREPEMVNSLYNYLEKIVSEVIGG